MNPIRVLIVDDSVIARRVITNALLRHEDVSVVGTAANGHLALAKLPQLAPDAVILDVEMPEMDGIATLEALRAAYPTLPVIMFSSLTERGAQVTLDALAAGANDYVLKPSAQLGETIEQVVSTLLVPKLKAVVREGAAVRRAPPSRAPLFGGSASPARPESMRPALASAAANNKKVRPLSSQSAVPPQILAIASSTGGPNALAEVIPLLPEELGVPVVIVQHMPPIFTRCLAERLDARARLKVIESEGDEVLMPGTVYIAPGAHHLEVVRRDGKVLSKLTQEPPENSCRPAADVLFRSVARAYGPAALGVVLTGMGHDGLLGARAMVEAGAKVIAQSGPTCVVWGMPRAVEEAGLCSEIVPLADMGATIERRVMGALLKNARSG